MCKEHGLSIRRACRALRLSRSVYAYRPKPRDDGPILNLRRKGKKRLPTRDPQPLAVPDLANICLSVDFMSDALYGGQRFRTFNVVDDFNPGKPTQNSCIERFNRTYREEVFDLYIFSRLSEVREITDRWLKEYNEERPHESLGNLTPAEYLALNSPQAPHICASAGFGGGR